MKAQRRSGMIDGRGAYFMLDGEDGLAIEPIGPNATGVVVIRPDGSPERLTFASYSRRGE